MRHYVPSRVRPARSGVTLPRVRITPSGQEVFADVGETLYQALIAAGVPLDAPCGGRGVCGRCRVEASGDLEPPSERERATLGEERLERGWRLACLARVAGDVKVAVSPEALARTVSVAARPPSGLAPGARGRRLGLAVDLGTTSIAAELVDVKTGARLGRTSLLNPQHVHGGDVLARVSYAVAGGLGDLTELARQGVNSAAAALLGATGADAGEVAEVTVVGNTVMLHLMAGADPSGLGVAPYTPAFLDERALPAGTVTGLPAAPVVVLPGAGAFLGADAVAAALATGVADGAAEPALLLDLGTNGELVLAVGDALFGASAAAGPAFEAVGVSSGMRAVPGAIHRVDVAADDIIVSVLGGGRALGVCGSGLLDGLAAAQRLGVVDATGRMHAGLPGPAGSRVRETNGGLEFVLTGTAGPARDDAPGSDPFEPARAVTITQQDVRALQLAKGALATAVRFLMRAAGLDTTAPVRLVVAGAFGSGLRPATAASLGIVPSAWASRLEQAGNAALEGAVRALWREGFRERLGVVAEAIEPLDLAALPGFQDAFLGSLALEPWGDSGGDGR